MKVDFKEQQLKGWHHTVVTTQDEIDEVLTALSDATKIAGPTAKNKIAVRFIVPIVENNGHVVGTAYAIHFEVVPKDAQ